MEKLLQQPFILIGMFILSAVLGGLGEVLGSKAGKELKVLML